MKTFGKFCLLLVVIGWFCPVACNLTGPQWLQSVNSDNDNTISIVCALGLLASAITALLGVLFAIVHLLKNGDEQSKDNIATSVLSLLFGAPFFIMLISYHSAEVLNYGAYLMISGWVLSLIFRLVRNADG